MAERQHSREIKCPHCGWVRNVPVDVIVDDRMGTPEQVGVVDTLKAVGHSIAQIVSDDTLDEAGAWIDIPACPRCKNIYQYNVRTEETRP